MNACPLAREYGVHHQVSPYPKQSWQELTAWAASLGCACCTLDQPATAHRSRLTTPAKRPRMDRPAWEYEAVRKGGDKFSRIFIFACRAFIPPGIAQSLLLSPDGQAGRSRFPTLTAVVPAKAGTHTPQRWL